MGGERAATWPQGLAERRQSPHLFDMPFRPTTLERAYALARSGACRTVSDIKLALASEGYERVQDALYGPSLIADLRKLCQANYVAPDG